jgi:hypothetical protein
MGRMKVGVDKTNFVRIQSPSPPSPEAVKNHASHIGLAVGEIPAQKDGWIGEALVRNL